MKAFFVIFTGSFCVFFWWGGGGGEAGEGENPGSAKFKENHGGAPKPYKNRSENHVVHQFLENNFGAPKHSKNEWENHPSAFKPCDLGKVHCCCCLNLRGLVYFVLAGLAWEVFGVYLSRCCYVCF